MARKLYYKILDDNYNRITDKQWDDILRLQHWYNSEFIWTAGKLGFKMYAVFPNIDVATNNIAELQLIIRRRHKELRDEGLSDNQAIQQLESEGLITAQRGGYFDKCIASGFTRVADNEFNAYLVCEFLLKASLLAPEVVINVFDEGDFIKSKNIELQSGRVIIRSENQIEYSYFQELINHRHVFSIVDPAKYNDHPKFQHTIIGFNDLAANAKQNILKDWNWLGFENNYDQHGDDMKGCDLNKKVVKFEILLDESYS